MANPLGRYDGARVHKAEELQELAHRADVVDGVVCLAGRKLSGATEVPGSLRFGR